MLPEWFRSVEQIPVGNQLTAPVSAERGGNVDHFGIKIADPLHFIVIIEVLALYHFGAFNDHERIYSGPLPFRHNSESQAGKF